MFFRETANAPADSLTLTREDFHLSDTSKLVRIEATVRPRVTSLLFATALYKTDLFIVYYTSAANTSEPSVQPQCTPSGGVGSNRSGVTSYKRLDSIPSLHIMSPQEIKSSASFILYDRVAETYERLYYTDTELALERPFLDRLLSMFPPHPRILDIGCGTAIEGNYLVDQGANYTGIDASQAMITIARGHTPKGVFRIADIRALPFGHESFDAVLALDSLIHFPKAELPQILRVISHYPNCSSTFKAVRVRPALK